MSDQAKTKKRQSVFCDTPPNVQIRELLDDSTVLKEALAKKIGVSSEAIRLWTTGYSRPEIPKLREIAHFFGVTTDYLLGNTQSKKLNMDYMGIANMTGLSDTAIEVLCDSNNGEEEILRSLYLFKTPEQQEAFRDDLRAQREKPYVAQADKSEEELLIELSNIEYHKAMEQNADNRGTYYHTCDIVNILCENVKSAPDIRESILHLIGDYIIHTNAQNKNYAVCEIQSDGEIDPVPHYNNLSNDDLLAIKMLKLQKALAEFKDKRVLQKSSN